MGSFRVSSFGIQNRACGAPLWNGGKAKSCCPSRGPENSGISVLGHVEFSGSRPTDSNVGAGDALGNLGKNADLPLYVCKVCGYTITKPPGKNCVSCREPARNYELIK